MQCCNLSRAETCRLPSSGAFLVLQLHDELIYEVCSADLEVVAALVQRCMQNALHLDVPLFVRLKTGPSWGRLLDYEFPPSPQSVSSP